MAANNEDEEPTVKKRPKPVEKDDEQDEPDPDEPVEEDGVVRAPEAPTTAPNAPSPDEESSEGPGRRVVDPTASAESDDEEDDEPDVDQGGGMRFGDEDASMDDFAAMLDDDTSGMPGDHQDLEVGDSVTGEVVEVGNRYIFVDIGLTQEGMVDRTYFQDEEGDDVDVEIGENLQLYVIGFEDGVELGPELGSGANAIEALEKAYREEEPVGGTVVATNKGGFEVRVAGMDAFCPISRIELGFTEEPEIHVGNTYDFMVDEIDDDGRTVVLDRAAILEGEREEQRQATLENIEVGDKIEGVVTRVADFGAFVDIGGVEGLVHISEISHVYFDNPSEVVQVGDNVEVEILEIEQDEDDEGDPLRISLSMKEAEEDPWMEVNEQFAVGETVVGTVSRLAPFGAFVQLMPGVDGLVHVSEMSRTEHVATPDEVVEPGDKVQVEIQDIDVMNKRIGLSMAAAQDDPWNDVEDRYALGMEVTGTVANIEDFGVFVDLEDGITALVPRSEMSLPSEVTPHRKFNRGEEISARVLDIEPERQRMALTFKEEEDIGADSGAADRDDDSGGPSSYTDDGGDSGRETLGTLGDLLESKKDDD